MNPANKVSPARKGAADPFADNAQISINYLNWMSTKKKLNRADYMFSQLKDQTVVKAPGSVEGF